MTDEEMSDYFRSKVSKFDPAQFSSFSKVYSQPFGSLKTVTTLEFSAEIPGPWKLGSMQIVDLYSALAKEDYFSMLDVLRGLIPEEKLDEFNALSKEDAIDVLNEWLGR